jgi:hypothetical protein
MKAFSTALNNMASKTKPRAESGDHHQHTNPDVDILPLRLLRSIRFAVKVASLNSLRRFGSQSM